MSEPAHTIGYLAQVACTWEVLARKAGNVCPGREFPDLTVNDFLVSAAAIAPVLDQAPHQPLGVTILRCIEETRKVVNTNTNLGIVLLLAPLASVPLDEELQRGLARVLSQTTVEDSRNVYKAIRLARPGGLGDAKEQDVKREPTLPLREVMALAMECDLIAAQYCSNFAFVLDYVLADVVRFSHSLPNIEWAIVETQISTLATVRDSLVLRKRGPQEALQLLNSALKSLDLGGAHGDPDFFVELDAWLRSDNHARNPGTTADLIAAALFVALREKKIALATPFVWEDHPFSEPEA